MNSLFLSALLAVSPLIGLNETDWSPALQKTVTVNREAVTLFRFAHRDGSNNHLYGEHLSLILDQNHRLKGFVRLEAVGARQDLPAREEAQKISDVFLRQVAPDLLQNRKILWIEPHDEVIQINEDGKRRSLTLTGMKVKSRNTKTGLYFWTIVNADRQVYVFERDIKWIVFPGKRGTEKWLHDAWLDEQWGGKLPISE
ncbi:MAG: hypothetical protein Q4G42_06970 [Neisseria sp.]|nr:hypothetical protein [Neisseria sp.]